MNVIQLSFELKRKGIRDDCYSINSQVKDEALILEKVTESDWRIYYSERGGRTAEKYFASELDACIEFLNMSLRDPQMKEG